MTDAAEDQHVAYSSSILVEKPPIEAMEALKIRFSQLKEINHQLAEWLTAYGRLRLRYSDELKKLAQRGDTLFTDLGNTRLQNSTIDSLGLSTPLWTSILQIAHDEVKYFDSTTRMMGRDMIAPLKLYTRRNESSLVEMDDLTELARRISSDKETTSDNVAATQWSERAPDFFESFERYDYNRLILLKDVFLKYQTETSDVLATFKKDNETGLEHILAFNPEDEIKRFSTAVGEKTLPIENIKPGELPKERPSKAIPSSVSNGIAPVTRRNVSHSPSKRLSLLPGRHHHNKEEETVGDFTNSPAQRRASTASSKFSTTSSTRKEKKHGVRSRFGTIFHRKKKDNESLHSSTIAESDASEEQPKAPKEQKETKEIKQHKEEPAAEPAAEPAVESAPDNTTPEAAAEPAEPVGAASGPYYPPMRPTKRSGSVVSGGSSVRNHLPTQKEVEEAPLYTEAESKPAQPEAQIVSPISSVSSPPPPPTSRKHVTSEVPAPVPLRNPHGSAPAPPAQRRISTIDSLLPASTGTLSSQNTGMSGNLTGGGGLVSGQIVHPSLTHPGLNASIVELFNASFKGGELVRSNAIGEVAFSYILDESVKTVPSKISLSLSCNSGNALPNFVVNTLFLQQDPSNSGSFVISDPSQINLRTVGGLKYMLNNPTPPLVIHPIWKHETSKSTVIISLKPADSLQKYLETGKIVLSNVLVSVSIQDAQAASAATKPSGSFNREKGRVTWNLPGGIVFDSSKKEERLIARFVTTGLAKESESGVQLRFTINNEEGAILVSGLNSDLEISAKGEETIEDPFSSTSSLGETKTVQSAEWSVIPTLKTIVAGGYSGHA
ncbi:DEKNAAC105102 [Brettanomyces naardenensis]|uniref:DEKNAAC105102 n=1 Tax=Brettanomyces naardenensis TaxID=13370 RepID=A0A448YSR1_BRENA|nr:DEKNAAC105102 [Brettanomyces naardenensis]